MSIKTIEENLKQAFTPLHLDIQNESPMHNVPEEAETHIKIIMAAQAFQGLSLVKRHQAVYAHLKNAMDEGLHAMSLHLFSIEEWKEKEGAVAETPACRGGHGK